MPDQVGIFVPLCSGPTIRKRKNNKKEKKSDRGHGETVGFDDVRSELRGNKERALWRFLETTQDQSERIKGKSWFISRMKSQGWR